MTQATPDLPATGVIDLPASNHAQQRGPHGAFRYFGKLSPDVTGAVLDAAAELVNVRGPLVDVMAGSGTTLIEAAERGWNSVGLEVNPVAHLYSRVKTRAVDPVRYEAQLGRLVEAPPVSTQVMQKVFARTRNSERWFSSEARRTIASLRVALDAMDPSRERSALLAVLLGRLRRMSNGSARTGRLFYDPESAVAPLADFVTGASELLRRVPSVDLPTEHRLVDARATGLPTDFTDFCFCHPPYFALYRFSADVLRFELEVGGFDRSAIANQEIREGWKSGDPKNLALYVRDMESVFQEARRITRTGGVLALVASNSTLGDAQLPVIDELASAADHADWQIAEHLVRRAHHGSASYHRSARADKVILQDHVLLLKAV